MKVKNAGWTAQIAILALFAAGCGADEKAAAPAPADSAADAGGAYVAPDSKGIQFITVTTSEIPEYQELPAHIEADPTSVIRVYPPTGGRIVEMRVRPWDHVEKGQLLALLDSGELSRAVADYHKAEIDNEVKQKALARAADLLAHKAIAQKDYQQAEADAQTAQAELNSSREQIRIFGVDVDHPTTQLRVLAPRSGVILDTGAAPGEFSKSLDAPAPLCTIANISTVWAMGDIYEKDFTGAKIGEQAQLTLNAYPDQHWQGRVDVVSGAVDPATRTLHVRVILQNSDGRIKPSMFGSIRLLRSRSPGILVPASAVIREGNNAYIFVGKGSNRFERRAVKLGRTFDGSLEILSGINPQDTIVSEGALLLRSGAQG